MKKSRELIVPMVNRRMQCNPVVILFPLGTCWNIKMFLSRSLLSPTQSKDGNLMVIRHRGNSQYSKLDLPFVVLSRGRCDVSHSTLMVPEGWMVLEGWKELGNSGRFIFPYASRYCPISHCNQPHGNGVPPSSSSSSSSLLWLWWMVDGDPR
jgi:hypothetical protein